MAEQISPIIAILIFTVTQLGSLIWVLSRTKTDSDNLKGQMSELKEELEKLGNVLVTIADFRGEINLLNERQLAQGKRFDETAQRVATQLDGIAQRVWSMEKGHGG